MARYNRYGTTDASGCLFVVVIFVIMFVPTLIAQIVWLPIALILLCFGKNVKVFGPIAWLFNLWFRTRR